MGVTIPNLAPFPITPELSAIAIAYRNPAHTLIADMVMPFVGSALGVKAFKWWEYNLADGFTVPDTLVGRKGTPNKVEWSAEEKDGSCRDHALSEDVPLDDVEQAKNTPGALSPLDMATERLTNLVMLGREKRVADTVFNPANYAPSNVNVLSGSSQFSDAASDPIKFLTEMLDTPIVRPNCLCMGQGVWTKIKLHPKVVKAIYPTGDGEGVVTRRQVAELLEVPELLVGASRLNMTRKGQTPNIARTWGNHIAAHFKDTTANNQGGVTWGYSLRYGTKFAGAIPDKNIGARGGFDVRSGETVAEVVAAKDAGFLILNAA